ncbi:MAG TPA: hypothetical protein VF026_30085 [Ktedonobacteraceae bacterium]
MTYYRLAVQDCQTTHWIWKTTAVTSLQAVFQLLRIYRMFPQNDTRVFTASSKEDLSEMLSRENRGLASSSVTAAQFLHQRNIRIPEAAQSISDQRASAQAVQQEVDVATWMKNIWERHVAAQTAQKETSVATTSPLREYMATTGTPASLGMSVQEKRRLEIELGPGGDHDTPYLFTLPISLKERLAWIRLQTRVQAGELPS